MVLATVNKTQKADEKVEPKAAKQRDVAKLSENIQQQVEETLKSPLDEIVGYAERAYAAHIEAERQLARAYRDNEVQVAATHRGTEQQAQITCDNAAAAALKVWEEAIAKATKAYEKVVLEAKEALAKATQDAETLIRKE